LGERTWGEFSELDEAAQSVLLDRRKRDPFHTYLNGGESMLQARLRSRALLERLSREHPGEVVVVFTHGEFIESLWSEIEHMSTEAHAPFFHSPEGNIRNCQLVLFRSVSAGLDLPFKIKTVESFCPTRNEFHRERELRRKPLSAAALLTEAETYAVLAIPSLQDKAECSGPGGC
jgi:broad specificity phosphatase PhoE